jgi:hypothetical protein
MMAHGSGSQVIRLIMSVCYSFVLIALFLAQGFSNYRESQFAMAAS